MRSKEYYDKIANDYSALLKHRARYLRAIENEINNSNQIHSYLDIGCGDGERSRRIIELICPSRAVLIDESVEMIKRFKGPKNINIETKVGDFLAIELNEKFDLISCLWNVFGHLDSPKIRLEFLIRMFNYLNTGGCIYIDVNNRYNAKNYGRWNVMKSMIKDFIRLKGRGYWNLKADNNISSKVYIHNPFELDRIIRKAGFSNFQKLYFDYDTGKRVNSFFQGQILYIIQK